LQSAIAMKLLLASAVVLLATSHARADSESADADTALRMSIVGSVAPVVAMGIGALLASQSTGNVQNAGYGIIAGAAIVGIATPALGELYGHQWFTGGMALRVGGLVVANVGLFLAYNTEIGNCTSSPCHLHGGDLGFVIAGAALYLGGTYLDIDGARDAARTWSHRHDVVVAPTALRSPSSIAPALALSLTF
jgi:hypothetical protein